LSTLINRIEELGFGGAKASFKQKLDEIKPERSASPDSQAQDDEEIAEEALQSGLPSYEVIDAAFNDLEQQLRDIADREKYGDGREVFKKAELIINRLPVPSSVKQQVGQLRLLRDEAVRDQGKNISNRDAINFQRTVSSILAHLPKIDKNVF
jgi:hypothetical protein